MSMKSSPRPADDELDRLVGLGITRQQVEPGDDCLDCLDPEVLAAYMDGGLSAEDRATVEAHLAGCHDCRRALALHVESDPLGASASVHMSADEEAAAVDTVGARAPAVGTAAVADGTGAVSTTVAPAAMGPAASGYAASGYVAASGATGAPGGSRDNAARPGIVKFASTWLPLAAALAVAAGLWGAFTLSRREAPDFASEPARISARNEPPAAPQTAAPPPEAARPSAPAAASPAAPSSADRAASAAGVEAPRELMRESSPAGTAAPSDKPSPSRADADGRAGQASALAARARGTYRDEAADAARPNVTAETDRRLAPAAPTPAPPPPPAPAALADAAPARVGGAAGQETGKDTQAKVAGQLAQAPPPSGAQPAAPAPTVAAQAGQQQNAPQQQSAINQTQQNVINQQTGPMANLNIVPPPAKTDERRQTESQRAANDAKRETANEKSAGGASNAKPTAASATPPAEEPKSVARAKAAPEPNAAAAPVDAASTKSANAAPGRKTEAESTASAAAAPRPSTEAAGRDTAFRTRIAVASPDTAAGSGAGAAAGARADDTNAGIVREAITVITSSSPATGPVLQSADGARWWRIRAPSTIESSADRGASWTVEYSDPSVRFVRGAAAAKGGCWMIGANGLVLRTRPDGAWERVTQPTGRNLVTLTATDHLIATVTDDQGRAWRTTDGGATWR